MPAFDIVQELGNGKKYETATSINLIESNFYERSPILSAHKDNVSIVSEARILTQEEIDDQIKIYITSLTKQLENLTRLIQGMSTAHRPNLSSRAGASASFSAANHSPDMVTGGIGTFLDIL